MGKPLNPTYHKDYYKDHKDEMKEQMIKLYFQHKIEVYRLYGSKCSCCNLAEFSVLEIDHINNDGSKHRKEMGGNGDKLYRYILKHYDIEKDRFQLLCANCHRSKTRLGQCYHNLKIEKVS